MANSTSKNKIRKPFVKYTAFGETKSVSKWLQDNRCRVSKNTLSRRLKNGIDFQSAISVPVKLGKSYKDCNLSKDSILEQYNNQNKSTGQIARELGIDPSLVITAMRQFSIPRRNQVQTVVNGIPKMFLTKCISNARRRKIKVDITLNDIAEIKTLQNSKCALSGLDLTFCMFTKNDSLASITQTASLDRIDSSKGYYRDNCQLLHKDVNIIKFYFDTGDFISYCQMITNNNKYPKTKIDTDYDIVCKSYWSSIRGRAKRSNLELSITPEYALDIYREQNGRCYFTGIPLILGKSKQFLDYTRTASIDRMDNTKGYIQDNIVWSHKEINRARKDYSIGYYKYLCELVYCKSYGFDIDSDKYILL